MVGCHAHQTITNKSQFAKRPDSPGGGQLLSEIFKGLIMGKNAQRRKAEKLAKKTQGATAPSNQIGALAVTAQVMACVSSMEIIANVIEQAEKHPQLNRAIEAERLVADWDFVPHFFKDGSTAIKLDLSRIFHSNLGGYKWTYRMHFACPGSVGDIGPMVKALRSRLPAIADAVRFLACMFIDTDQRTSTMLEDILLPPHGYIHDKDGNMIYFGKRLNQAHARPLHSFGGKVAFSGHIEDMVLNWRQKLLPAWGRLNGIGAYQIGKALRAAKFTKIKVGDEYGFFDTELVLNRKKVPAKVWVHSETMEVFVSDKRSLTAIGGDFNNKSHIVKTPKPFSSLFSMSHLTMDVTEEMYGLALSLGQIPKPDTSNVINLGPVDFSAGVAA
jgi:hypothetical protein